MTWQAMSNLAYNDIVTESDLDKIRENLEFIGGLQVNGADVSSLSDGATIAGVAYDSGWFAVAHNNTYTKAHSLAAKPRLVMIWHSTASDGNSEWVPLTSGGTNSTYPHYPSYGVDGTNVYLVVPDNASSYAVSTLRRSAIGGYARILAWE